MDEVQITYTGKLTEFGALPEPIHDWLTTENCRLESPELHPWYRQDIDDVGKARRLSSLLLGYGETKGSGFASLGEVGSTTLVWPIHLNRLPYGGGDTLYYVGQDNRTKAIYWAEIPAK